MSQPMNGEPREAVPNEGPKAPSLTVGIVGAGLMGTGIAEVAAAAGFATILVKATPGAPDAALKKIDKSLARQVEKGKLTAEAKAEILGRITATGDLGALAPCDLVIESIVEELGAKRELFAQLDKILAPHAILATNTSTLKVAALAAGLGRAERTIGLHFFSPVPAMKLVEIAHCRGTDPTAVETATKFVAALGKTGVPVLDSTGFIVNRLLVPFLVGAIAAYEKGLAPAAEIDTAMRLGCGHPMGPLALADAIGLDVVHAMATLLTRDFRDQRYAPPAILSHLVTNQRLGKKSKLGFFDYSGEAPRENPELQELIAHGAFLEKVIERDAA